MSHHTWHNYGYGICTDKLENTDVSRIQALLRCAPEYEKVVQKLLQERGITNPTVDDYFELDITGPYRMASILQDVILEAENLLFTACDDYNSNNYLLYMPSYPWHLQKKEHSLTEEAVRQIFVKYTSILGDEVFEVDYESVENGG